MIVKNARYKTCKCCGFRKRVSDEIYGCDICKKKIDYNDPKGPSYLEVTTFYKEDCDTTRHHLCSWGCVYKLLPRIKSDHFVSLPFLKYDEKGMVDDFFKVFYGKNKKKGRKK